jgi:hypothetical protein
LRCCGCILLKRYSYSNAETISVKIKNGKIKIMCYIYNKINKGDKKMNTEINPDQVDMPKQDTEEEKQYKRDMKIVQLCLAVEVGLLAFQCKSIAPHAIAIFFLLWLLVKNAEHLMNQNLEDIQKSSEGPENAGTLNGQFGEGRIIV